MFITIQRHRCAHDESGFILATVILLTLVLTVITISILSLNVSQTLTGQSVVDDIKAEQLALGSFYKYQQLKLDNCPNPPCTIAGNCLSCPNPSAISLDQKQFSIVVNEIGAAGSNFNDTDAIDVDVYY